ncbi:hypothetical protein MAJHIDBO_01376 [Propionibacterium freudenreichii subsp. shermanii]|nr:hypothetical protein MAJHIDBO_01376 [Propionibacterium freudenreichii subsp. shermanii]SPS09170.1 hypothetical protein MAJHIDBO_01376 [Propionibacterium freudenreichii subsp. shermanii]
MAIIAAPAQHAAITRDINMGHSSLSVPLILGSPDKTGQGNSGIAR